MRPKQMIYLILEAGLVILCCYLIAVIFTIFAVGFGSIVVDDMSAWSEHVRTVAVTILK